MIKVHVKNNRWAAGSFPNTPEGEEVFSITEDRYLAELEKFPDLKQELSHYIDWDTDNFNASMADADVLLTWNLPTENLGEIAPNLKWIHIIGAGVEHLLPMNWMPQSVTLTNNKGVHSDKAGEFGLMSVLMLHSHMPAILTNQQTKTYESLYSTPIEGRTLVVVGTGSLGGATAKAVSALGAHVIGVNRHGKAVPGCNEVVRVQDIEQVLPRANYIFLAVPDTPETRGLMNAERLDMLKAGAGIVNVGRESVMDYDALCDRLESGRLGGAILDVFDPEPIATGSRLWTTRNLVVTPHVSADDGDTYVPMTLDLFFRNMQRFVAGESLLNPVRPDLGY